MLESKITSGNVKIVLTGSVISFKSNPVTFHFGDKNALKVTVIFKTDDASKFHVESELKSTNELILNIFNAKNVFGAGSINPVNIGENDNGTLYLNLRIHGIDSSEQKVLHYTFYEEPNT